MLKTRRRCLRAAAFGSLVAILSGSAVFGQETNTIGPPQLKDFQLPGQRTTPPATPPAPTVTAPLPRPSRPTAAPPTPSRPVTARPSPADTRRRPAAAPARTPPAAAPTPAPVPPAAQVPEPQILPPAPAATAPPPPRPVRQSAPPSGRGWLWFGLPLLLALAAFLLLRRRRRPDERGMADSASLGGALLGPEPVPPPKWLPEAQPEPVAEPVAEEAPRAWVELDIVPERAAATDNETIVNYELVLRNAGAATAGNIRIDAKMFNAGADGEIADFFAKPIHAHSGSPHVTISAGGELKLGSAIAMPKTEVRTIEVQGRAIFVPMIAINVAYDWDGGTGRSSKSWLLGREADTPVAKMGPFRLDLGPRIYRQVGRREAKLEMV